MKKCVSHILSLSLAMALALTSLTGCGVLGKITGKSSSGESGQSTGVTSGNPTGGAQSQNTTVSGDVASWPKDKMGDLVRPNAPITAVINDDATSSCVIAFADMSKEDAEKYIKDLKSQGYVAETELTDDQGILFYGVNPNGAQVTFAYNFAEKDGTISYAAGTGTPGNSTGNGSSTANGNSTGTSESVDMTDVSPWPAGFLSGMPELKGKITNVLNQNDETMTVDFDYVEKADFEAFVAAIKAAGYTEESDETKDSYEYDYSAYNANGDYVDVSTNFEYKTAIVYMEKYVS